MSMVMTPTAPEVDDPAEDRHGRGATWAVARREARLLLRHPLIAVGVVLSGWVAVAQGWGELPELARFSSYTGLGLAPLAAAALFVGALNASRAQRDGTDELYDILGVTQRQRTSGHLLGALAILPLALLLVAAWVAYLYLAGGAGAPNVAELLTGPAVATFAAMTGVTVATWFPTRLAGLLTLVAIAVLQVSFAVRGETSHWLGLWHTATSLPAGDLWIRPSGMHLVYLAGLIGVAAAVGRLQHRPRGGPVALGVAALALVAVAGGLQLRAPTDADIEARFAQVEHPQEFWACEQRDTVTYCAFPAYTRWTDTWHRIVTAALEPVPTSLRPMLRVEQHRDPYLRQIQDELGYTSDRAQALHRRADALFSAAQNERGGGPIRVGETFQPGSEDGFTLALEVAQRAVGLPVEETLAERRLPASEYEQFRRGGFLIGREGEQPFEVVEELPDGGAVVEVASRCRPDGQAREAVALWLAARANPGLADRIHGYRTELLEPRDADSSQVLFRYLLPDGETIEMPWEVEAAADPFHAPVPWTDAVMWSAAGIDLTAQLLALPRDEVAAILAGDWETWTAPSTQTRALVATFDLEAPIDGEQFLRRAGYDPDRYPGWVAAFPDHGDNPPPPACA